MPDEDDRYRPFERCGYIVCHVHPAFKEDSPRVRVAMGRWATYLEASFYDELEGDDEAFRSIMDARRADAEREQAAH